MQPHPAANLFPRLDTSRLEELADDIAENGQRELIVVWKGMILDGRNRVDACELAGVEPRYRTIEDPDLDPVAFVLSANLHRRHLNESQRATVAAKLKKILAPAAKERQKRKPNSVPVNLPEQKNGDTRDQAAAMLNVSGSSVDHAAAVLEHGSKELIESVEGGSLAVSRAAAIVKTTPKAKQLAAAKKKAPKNGRAKVPREERERFEKAIGTVIRLIEAHGHYPDYKNCCDRIAEFAKKIR